MNFYIQHILAIAHLRYEERYWEHCDMSDRFWMSIYTVLKKNDPR